MRYAIRTLGKNPGFSVTCIAVLALAIGANSAMFSALDAVLLRPLPYRSPGRLAMLWTERPSQNRHEGRSAYWNVEQWKQQSRSFTDVAVFDPVSVALTNAGGAEHIQAARISPNLFPLLGVYPLRGRLFSAKEATERQPLVLISYRFWQSHFGGSTAAIGASLDLDGLPSRITGILPRSFEFPRLDADVWEPATMFPDWETRRSVRGDDSWFVLGRLRPTVTFDDAQAELNAIARRVDEQLPPSDRNLGISVVPLTVYVTGPRARLALWMLTGAVFFVLLIAASNISSLSLARSAGRVREMAIRTALGASRARIVRQLLAESLTLAAISGLLGLFIASAGMRLILALKPGDLFRLNEISLDWRVLGCAVFLCFLTGILVGFAPAINMARRDIMPSGQRGARGMTGGIATRRIRSSLVASEFALALILLAGAGLLIRSLWSVENVDVGFRPQGVLSMQLAIPELRAPAQQANLYSRVLERIQSLPGVEGAGIVGDLFISGIPEQVLTAEQAGSQTISEPLRYRRDEASSGFFTTIGTPLLRGRFFSSKDGPDGPRVAIINDAMAHRLWPAADPVGKRIRLGAASSANSWLTIVGVAGDMRRQGLENEPVPQLFQPLSQSPSRFETLLVRTSLSDPLKMRQTLTAAVHRVEKHVLVYSVTTLENQLETSRQDAASRPCF